MESENFAEELKLWILQRDDKSVLNIEKNTDEGLEVMVLKDQFKKEVYVIKGRTIN